MKIIKLLYLKYSLSFSICLISSFIIFFIFSLLGNLNEDYLFKTIINISILNSAQIFTYVPEFIFLLSVVLLIIFLRSKNEIIIISSYMSFKKLIIFFFPIILIFTFLEISKKDLSSYIEDFKTKLIDEKNYSVAKILIEKNKNSQNYTVFNNIDLNNFDKTEYRTYEIINNKIVMAEFSDDLTLHNDGIMANNYILYKDNLIKDIQAKKFFKNLSDKNIIFNKINFSLLVFSIFLYTYIFLIFFNKKYVNTKQSLIYPIFISLIFLIYSFLIFNNSLTFYKNIFELSACLIIGVLILRLNFNE